jgi:hypothetical protein
MNFLTDSVMESMMYYVELATKKQKKWRTIGFGNFHKKKQHGVGIHAHSLELYHRTEQTIMK